jgi:hypothetical protein
MTTNIQSFAGDVEIHSGNLSVKSLEVKDPLTKLGANNASHSNVGVVLAIKDGQSNIAIAHQHETGNIVIGYTNENVAGDSDELDILEDSSVNVFVYGNLYAHYLKGNGYALEGIVTDLQSVSLNGANTDQTVFFTNATTGINVSSNVLVSGNVTANIYFGDGGLLSNITQTLEGITGIGNTTPYTIECNNPTTSLVTASNVGISNANPTADLCVGANVVIDDTSLNKIDVVGNVACYQLNLGTIEVLPAYSLENVTQISNSTTRTISFNNSTLAFETQKMAGIGIVPSSADVGVSGLHVDGHLRLGGEAENTDEEQMYIKAAGALGVLANESDTNNTNTELRLQSGDTNNSNITMVGKSSAQYMTFGTNAAERMRIDGSGNVGIGTNSPSAKFHIYEGSDSTPVFRLQANVASRSAYTMYTNSTDSKFAYCGIDGNGLFTHSTGALALGTNNTPIIFSPNYTGGEKMRIDTAGNVCIGGTNTKTKLHITHDGPDYTDSIAYDRVRIMNRVTTGDAQYIGNEYGLQMGVSGTGNSSIQTIGYINSTDTVEAQYNLQLQPNGGYVGIGTTNPTSNLDVIGATAISTDLTVGTAGVDSNVILHANKTYCSAGRTTTYTGLSSSNANEIGYLDMSVISTSNNTFVKVFVKVGQGAASSEMEYSFYIRPNAANWAWIYDYKQIGSVNIVPVVYRTDADDLYNGGTPGVVRFGYLASSAQSVSWRVEMYERSGTAKFVPTNTGSAVDGTGLVQVTPAPYMRIDSNVAIGENDLFVDTQTGFVGVGTTNPTSNLHVVGDINVTSNIVMNGEVFIKAHDATSNHVAIGPGAGQSNQGTNAVAVGYLAGETNQHANTVVLNATGSALNTEGTGRTYIKPLRVATVASNVMTYDQTTGEVMDSGGLISNKFAIVSEQPPSALTGATTTIQGHGRYKVTSSSMVGSNYDYNIFSKNETDTWISFTDTFNVDGTYAGSESLGGVSGEWVKLEMPYKTTLRHFTLRHDIDNTVSGQLKQFPVDFKIVASNDDTNWQTLNTTTGVSTPEASDPALTFVVNASASYKFYAIVVEKITSGANFERCQIGEWRLFTESFSVDGGIVTTTAASGLETGFTEHPVEAMANPIHYAEGHGTYEASVSSFVQWFGGFGSPFDKVIGSNNMWASENNWDSSNVYTNARWTTDVGGTRHYGEWLQLKLPYAITLAYSEVYPRTSFVNRGPGQGVILGSNDGEHWYKLTEYSGKTYVALTATNIQVNATTPYQYFRMTVNKLVNADSDRNVNVGEWRLFSATGVTKMDNVLISGELAVDGGALQTGYIKWPKVPLKANESEGYVASASSDNGSVGLPYHAFEDKGEYSTSSSPVWSSTLDTFSGGVPINGTAASFDGNDCEWLQIQMPRSIQLSYFLIYIREYNSQTLVEGPKSGFMYGSNDGVVWTKLVSYDNLVHVVREGTRVDVQSTEAYKYFRLVVTSTVGTPTHNGVVINELQLFESTLGVGTSATTAKLTVDGGLGLAKGAEFFAGDDVVTEFPKHDRPLVKYPEVTLTSNSDKGYSIYYSSSNSSYPPLNLFNDDLTDRWLTTINGGDEWTGTTYTGSNYITDANGTQHPGAWIKLKMPKQIKLSYVVQRDNNSSPPAARVPAEVKILGTNDSTNFHLLKTFTGLSNVSLTETLFVNETQTYNEYAYVMKDTVAPEGGIDLSSLEFWGYEEGDESVDVVHRSIPNKPSQQQLAVYYEARDPNSYSFADSSNVYDLSGNGVTGTITGNNGFDAEYNAWVFDGSGDYISGTLSNPAGDWTHSLSMWVNLDLNSLTSSFSLFFIGVDDTGYEGVGVDLNSSKVLYYFTTNGNSVIFLDWTSYVRLGEWTHIIFMHTPTTKKIYINGAEVGSVENDVTLALPANTSFYLGNRVSTKSTRGKIANARLYSKALNADQVRELYEYDAPRFGHRQNLVALHKGNLGVGVTNPTSRFEVAGADGLQEYPPRGITLPGASYSGTRLEEYIEGHGLFVVDGTSSYTAYDDDRRSWNMFEKLNRVFHANGTYATTGTPAAIDVTTTLANNSVNFNFYTRLSSGGTIFADWVQLELPHKILLKQNSIKNHNILSRSAAKGYIVASNDGLTFDVLNTITDFGYTTTYQDKVFETTTNTYYRIFRILFTHKVGGDANGAMNMGEWRLFGTPAPSSLEDGHLTLGKALTLPRVSGHPAGAETPRAESLVVHYDTTVDSVVSGSMVVDISGEGNNGTLYGNTSYSSSTRSFDFDGLGADYVLKSSPSGLPTGDAIYSMSAWINTDSSIGSAGIIISFGSSWTINNIASMYIRTGNQLGASTGGNFVYTTNAVLSYNTWHHVAITKKSTGAISTAMFDLYVDGTLITATTVSGTGTQNLGTITGVSVGMSFDGSSNEFHGKISKPKLWNVALTAEEVGQEYALGRTGKSLNLTDTAFCLGGTVPRAQLDVRGSALVAGNLEIVGSLAATDIEASSFITERVILKESWPNASLVGNLGTWENSNLTGPSYGATPDGYRTLEFTNPNDTGFLTSGTFDLRKYALVDGSFASDTQTKTSTRVFLKAWINTDSLDNNDTDAHLYIEFSPDNGTTWHKVYRDDSNEDLGTGAGWKMAVADLSPYIDATTSTQCKIRFHCAAIGSADFYKFGQIFIYESGVPTNLGGMWLGAGGKIGIGTNDPAYKLDVHGTSNVGALTATSVTQTTPVIYKAYLVNGTGINVNASVTYTEYAIFGTGYTESINSGSFTLSGTTKVVAPSTGYYRLSFNICFLGSGGQRTNIGVKPVIEGTELDEYSGSNYIRYANAHNEATTNMTTLIHLTGNRQVGLAFARLTDITNAVYIDPGSYIILEKI